MMKLHILAMACLAVQSCATMPDLIRDVKPAIAHDRTTLTTPVIIAPLPNINNPYGAPNRTDPITITIKGAIHMATQEQANEYE